MTFSVYDGIMLAIVVYAVIHGAVKGIAWQLAPIASIVLGYLFAVPLSAATAPWFGEPPLNRVFSLIVMYTLVSLGVYLIARSLRESIEKTKLVEFDRHLGALLGGVKGVLFTTVLTVALLSVSPTAAGFIVKSESHTIASRIVNIVCPLLPQDVHRVIDPYLKPLHDHADDEPLPFAADDARPSHDVAQHEDGSFTPRTRRHNPIFEDDSPPEFSGAEETASRRRRSDGFENGVDNETPPRRRRSIDDVPSSGEEDHGFGADPNRFGDDERPSRFR
jgi:membrane protein required for colicin V production